MQERSVLAEPRLRFFDVPHQFANQIPESRTVIHVPQMRDFMCHHIVEHKRRRENEAPRKRECTRGRT